MNDSRQLSKKINSAGFTLIELLIVAAIIGILSAIAYPAYMDYVRVANRSDGIVALASTKAQLGRFYSDNNVFANAANTFPAGIAAESEAGNYTISIATAGTFQTYVLTATLQGVIDAECGNLTLTSTGIKGVSTSADADVISKCWSR